MKGIAVKKWIVEHWSTMAILGVGVITWAVETWDASNAGSLEAIISRAVAMGFLGFYLAQDVRFWINDGLYEWRAIGAGQGGDELADEPEPVRFVEQKPLYPVNGKKLDAVQFLEGDDGDAWHTRDAA